MADLFVSLSTAVGRLVTPAAGRYVLLLWDAARSQFGRPLPCSPLVLRGDPPTFVTMNGDLITVEGRS